MSGIRNDKLRRLYQEAIRQGWTSQVDGGGHLVLTGPSGRRFTISMTGGGVGRHFENTRAQAKRAGLDVSRT